MDSLLPSLKRTIFFSIFSLILLVIIPRDPENARFLGFSALRLLMLAFFMALTTLLLAAYFILRKNPAHQQAIQQILTEYAEKRWLREPFLFVTSSITLIGLLLLVNYFFSTNVQLKGYILRLAPLLFFLTACALQAMRSRFLIAYSRKWLLGISFALLYTAAGLFVSKFFLGQLTRPYVITPRMRDASQAGAIWISLLLFTQLAAAPPKERRLWLLVLLIAATIFTIQWYTYPRSYWRERAFPGSVRSPGDRGHRAADESRLRFAPLGSGSQVEGMVTAPKSGHTGGIGCTRLGILYRSKPPRS